MDALYLRLIVENSVRPLSFEDSLRHRIWKFLSMHLDKVRKMVRVKFAE